MWSAGVTLFLMAFEQLPWELPFPFDEEEKAWKESSAGFSFFSFFSFFFLFLSSTHPIIAHQAKKQQKKQKRSNPQEIFQYPTAPLFEFCAKKSLAFLPPLPLLLVGRGMGKGMTGMIVPLLLYLLLPLLALPTKTPLPLLLFPFFLEKKKGGAQQNFSPFSFSPFSPSSSSSDPPLPYVDSPTFSSNFMDLVSKLICPVQERLTVTQVWVWVWSKDRDERKRDI